MSGIVGCAPTAPTETVPSREPVPLSTSPPPLGTVFDKLPPATWLHGPPRPFGSPDVKGYVLDFWGQWCPFCKEASGGLAKLAAEYQPKGIVFLSISKDEPVEAIRQRHQFAWNIGWAVPNQSLAEWDAFNFGMGDHNTGYAVKPVTYLLDGSGKLIWTDNAARFRHRPAAEWHPELKTQLDQLLNAKP